MVRAMLRAAQYKSRTFRQDTRTIIPRELCPSNKAEFAQHWSSRCCREDELIGTFPLSRQEVRPFTDKQIELVTNFAGSSCHRHRERAAAQRTPRKN